MRVAVVIPVKSFTVAKGRLADTLTAAQRSELAQSCAETVVRAALSLPTYVVCSDEGVASWASALGAHIVDCQTPGLDIAVATGRAAAQADGADHIVVAHADLPLAVSFNHIAREGKVSLVPDRHLDAGLEYEIIIDNALALDLDTADDLSELARRETEQS